MMSSRPNRWLGLMRRFESPTRRLGAILRIASHLSRFARLRISIESEGAARVERLWGRCRRYRTSCGKPLVTEEDIYARIQEMADEPRLLAHDVNASARGFAADVDEVP